MIGRFMSAQEECEGRASPSNIPSVSPAIARFRTGRNATVRRNGAISLSRRDAGWPRV